MNLENTDARRVSAISGISGGGSRAGRASGGHGPQTGPNRSTHQSTESGAYKESTARFAAGSMLGSYRQVPASLLGSHAPEDASKSPVRDRGAVNDRRVKSFGVHAATGIPQSRNVN